MNREIKFRGMDANGIMRYGRLSQDKPDTTVYYSEYSQRICWDNSNIPVSNKTLSQYTGLKDKNGKEIYEGDVLKWKYVNDNGYRRRESGAIFSVFYNEGTAEYKTSDGDSLYTCLNDSIEVIGNIYENPELITNL